MYHFIIPTYNRADLLQNAIDSILRQKTKDYYIYIINDGGKDNTDEVIEKYTSLYSNIIYLKKENGGVGSARNRGIEAALKNLKSDNDYVIFLDDDDLITDNFLEEFDEIQLQTNYKNVYVFGCINQDGKIITNLNSFENFKEYNYLELFCNEINEGFGSIKINIFKNKLYRFEENINGGEGYLRIKIGLKYKSFVIKKYYRIYNQKQHESLINLNKITKIKLKNDIDNYQGFLNLYEKHLQTKMCSYKYGEIYLVLARFLALYGRKLESLKYYIRGRKYNKSFKYTILYIIGFIDFNLIIYNTLIKISNLGNNFIKLTKRWILK